jgi:hypothetical protein
VDDGPVALALENNGCAPRHSPVAIQSCRRAEHSAPGVADGKTLAVESQKAPQAGAVAKVKPRLIAAPLTSEDLDIWHRVNFYGRGASLWHRSADSDRRDAGIMLSITIAYERTCRELGRKHPLGYLGAHSILRAGLAADERERAALESAGISYFA